MTAAITAREEMILPSESNRSNRALDGVGVQFDAAVVQEAGQTMPARQRVPDRFGERAASRQQRKLRLEPGAQGVDDRLGARATNRKPLRRRLTVSVRFDGVEFADPAQRLDRDRRVRGLRHVVELASRMAPACGENDVPFVRQRLEPGVAVDMENAAEPLEMRGWTFGFAVRRIQDRPRPAAPARPRLFARGRRPTAVPSWCALGLDRAPARACRRRTDGPTRTRSWRDDRAAPRATSRPRRPSRPASNAEDRSRGGRRFAPADTRACDRNIC